MYVRLNIPRSVKDVNDKELERVGSHFKARKLTLGDKQRKRLERLVAEKVETWKTNTSKLQSRLRELSEFYDGKEEEVDFPFGAGQSSTINTKYAQTQGRTLAASFRRSVKQDAGMFVAQAGPGSKLTKELRDVEDAVNWTAEYDTDAVEVLLETCIPIYRDSTTFVHGEWDRRIESGVDFKTYANVDEFLADYPEPQDAGVEEDRFNEILEYLAQPDNEVHVEYELDFVAANKPKYTGFPLAKFIWEPIFSKTVQEADIYGFSLRQSGTQFEILAKKGYYDPEAIEDVRSKKGGDKFTSWDESRDDTDGINSADGDSESYEIANLVCSLDLNKDSIPERYKVIWSLEANKALRVERYDLRKNIPNVVPFRFIKKDGRLLGESLLFTGLDLYKELNALHRHRSNVRRLTDSVTLIAPDSIKERVDLAAEYAEFKPGMTLWVPDQYMDPTKGIRQFVIQGTSRTNESLDEENLVVRYLDIQAGISQGQSGRDLPTDPSAPGNKTAMLLQRADFRVEDYIEEWRKSVPDFVDLHRSLYYQNMPSKIRFMARAKGEWADKEIQAAILGDPSVRFSLRAIKPGADPATEMNKIAAIAMGLMQFGGGLIIQMNPGIIVELWNRYVMASRLPIPEKLMVQVDGAGNASTAEGAPVAPQQLLAMMVGGVADPARMLDGAAAQMAVRNGLVPQEEATRRLKSRYSKQ
jgi:hypothetical protein